MGVEIAISIAREETRVAVLDNGVVTDLYGDRAKDQDYVGNIYKGRVAKVLPGMQAAFIDIGLEKAAFMHVSDLSMDVEPSSRATTTTIRTRKFPSPSGKVQNRLKSCCPRDRKSWCRSPKVRSAPKGRA